MIFRAIRAIDTREKDKMERRSVVRCRCVVVHAACIVDDPSDWCVPNCQKHVVVFVSASTHFDFPLYSSCFRFFLLHLLPKKSNFFHSSCIFLVFPFFTLAFESFFLDLSTELKNYSLS